MQKEHQVDERLAEFTAACNVRALTEFHHSLAPNLRTVMCTK